MIMTNPRLDLSLIRLARLRGRKMPQEMGTAVDSYEAMLNELQLQTDMLTSQASIEVQKAEVLTQQLITQINTAEAGIIEQLNTFSKDLVATVADQVTVSEASLKFTGTDIYDMSFIKTMDYNAITILNEKTVLQSRIDNREVYKNKMIEMKAEVTFHQGLINHTASDSFMMKDLCNARNHFLLEYYKACIYFYQEATVIGFLHNPTNNIENLKEYIKLNELNIPLAKTANENSRISKGEQAYNNELTRIKYIEKMLLTAKFRLKYIMMAYAGKWAPPSFDSLMKIAEERNLSLSRTVYDLSETSRQSLCIPDWIIGIAEMYNQIEMFDQGCSIVPLNPYNPIWIRKAKEVINLEAEGVVNTAQKLFIVIDKYWTTLVGAFEIIENLHVDAVLAKASVEDNSTNYVYPYKDTGITLVYFDDNSIVENGM